MYNLKRDIGKAYFNFVMWQSSISQFIQIWLHDKYENKKATILIFFHYLLEFIKIWWFGFFFNSNIEEFGFFFPWKIIFINQNHIFPIEVWQNFITKENIGHLAWLCLKHKHVLYNDKQSINKDHQTFDKWNTYILNIDKE
jgi:hypothetical protein